jgi:hypothetical protein
MKFRKVGAGAQDQESQKLISKVAEISFLPSVMVEVIFFSFIEENKLTSRTQAAGRTEPKVLEGGEGVGKGGARMAPRKEGTF